MTLRDDLMRDEGCRLVAYREAINIGEKRYFNGKPCPHGHIAQRYVSTRACVECTGIQSRSWSAKNVERASTRKRRWYERNADHQTNTVLKRKYGISLEKYNEMFSVQDGKCAICSQPAKPNSRLLVDHCHETGFVRGLLCSPCNTGIGGLKDNIRNLERAIEYLKLSRESE